MSSELIINSFVNSFPLLEKQYSSDLEKKYSANFEKKIIFANFWQKTRKFSQIIEKKCANFWKKDMQILTKFSQSFDKKKLRIFGMEG